LDYPIIELSGKTLGILGYGELGQAVAKLAEAFGMRVLVGNLPNRPHADSTRVGFDDLLAQSDFISLHCPLTDDTRDLIDAQAFAKMKKRAFLINCARGGIVNEAALADALKQGEIAGAATDVLTVEPQPIHRPMFKFKPRSQVYCKT
jgi:glycerate dehydrogenase